MLTGIACLGYANVVPGRIQNCDTGRQYASLIWVTAGSQRCWPVQMVEHIDMDILGWQEDTV